MQPLILDGQALTLAKLKLCRSMGARWRSLARIGARAASRELIEAILARARRFTV